MAEDFGLPEYGHEADSFQEWPLGDWQQAQINLRTDLDAIRAMPNAPMYVRWFNTAPWWKRWLRRAHLWPQPKPLIWKNAP